MEGSGELRAPRRVRHELRFRRLTVTAVRRLTPGMIRVTLGGPELEGFHSPGFDDHVKLFFPAGPGEDPALPVMGPQGPAFPEGTTPSPARDYTPRRHDAAAGTLDIDFALHEAGPATAWAEQARPGWRLGVGGPRGSFLLPTAFDWHLLVGDDTALPAIARRLEELPAGAIARVVAEVEDAAGELAFDSRADVDVTWVHRRGRQTGCADGLDAALRDLAFPAGDFHAWVACESGVAKTLRTLLLSRGADPRALKAAGYWRRGAAAVHEQHE